MAELKLKRTSDGQSLELGEDGNPILLRDGEPEPLRWVELLGQVKSKADQLDTLKKERDTLAARAKLFGDDVEDPAEWMEKARKALETVAHLDDKKLVDAGEMEQLKRSLGESFAAQRKQLVQQLTEAQEKAAESERRLHDGVINRSFLDSPFVNGPKRKLALPPDIAQTYFGRHFRVEPSDDGREAVRAYWPNGDPIMSQKAERAGDPADFDEAIQLIVDKYPRKDEIMLGSGASGSGGPTNGRPAGSQDLSKLPPVERLKRGFEQARA